MKWGRGGPRQPFGVGDGASGSKRGTDLGEGKWKFVVEDREAEGPAMAQNIGLEPTSR